MVSWDGEKPSKPKKRRSQKCTKKGSLFWTPIEASRGKKGKIRYVLNGISENMTCPDFGGQKNSDISGRMEVEKSLFERVAPTPRNPYKTSAKPLPPRGIWTHPGDQIPLFESLNVTKFPSYSIYIYRERERCLSLSLSYHTLSPNHSLPLSQSFSLSPPIPLSKSLSRNTFYTHTPTIFAPKYLTHAKGHPHT